MNKIWDFALIQFSFGLTVAAPRCATIHLPQQPPSLALNNWGLVDLFPIRFILRMWVVFDSIFNFPIHRY